ncbi:hypothetical protein [Acidaminococcus timonensis]|uniref:hypothetical protein n=1 Tax=Acidaminococcus timonensis TaxID=1871002 RepID=UPI002942A359|nr:hypothetical protein [Acidaminococcus timonensis]
MKTIYSKHKTLGRSLTAAILLSLALPVLPGEAAETISRWGRTSATEGDSIAVDINGWGGEAADPVNLTVGKDTTQKVTIGEYNAGPYSTTTVKGKKIVFTGYTGVGSGSITIGDATATDSIHFAKNLNAYRSGWDDSLSGGTIIARSAGDITVDGNINATNTPTLDLAGKDLTVAGRTFFQDGSSSLKGTDTVTLGTAGSNQNSLQVNYSYGKQSLYVGGEKAVTTLNGDVFLTSDGPQGNKVTLDGSRITLNATVKPGDTYDWSGLYAKDVDVTVGNQNTETTTLNGNLMLSGGSVTLHGTANRPSSGPPAPTTIRCTWARPTRSRRPSPEPWSWHPIPRWRCRGRTSCWTTGTTGSWQQPVRKPSKSAMTLPPVTLRRIR